MFALKLSQMFALKLTQMLALMFARTRAKARAAALREKKSRNIRAQVIVNLPCC